MTAPLEHRFLVGPCLLAVTGSLMWIVSAWLPMRWWVFDGEREPVNYFWNRHEPTFWISATDPLATGDFIVAIGVIMLLLGLFRLNYLWLCTPMLLMYWAAVSTKYPYGTEPAYADDWAMGGSVVLLLVASIWENRRRARFKRESSAALE